MFFDVYQLTLNITKQDLTDLATIYSENDTVVLDCLLLTATGWSYSSTDVELSGSIKGKKLRVTKVTLKTNTGLDIIKELAISTKGTVIGVIETTPVFISKGNEFPVTLLELQQGVKRVSEQL
jgi:hypothetical protein